MLLIGSGGAGKSTLARRLADRTGLPLVHLDALYWRAGWVETPKPEWVSTVERLVRDPAWVMDGNYGGTLDLRLAACDTVILLDVPPWRCLWRVLKRRVSHAGRSRPDMAPGCPERLDAGFLWWIATYRARRLPKVLSKLRSAASPGMRLVILRSSAEIERFLASATRAVAGSTPAVGAHAIIERP